MMGGVVAVCFSMFQMGIHYVSERGLILEPGLTMGLDSTYGMNEITEMVLSV